MDDSVRTCLACRKKAEKNHLLRFVRALDGEICFDIKSRLPNRGAWVCADIRCLEKAFAKRLLFRGEKNLALDSKKMVEEIVNQFKKSILSGLGLLRRQGKVEVGKDAVIKSIRDNFAYRVIFAKDYADGSRSSVESALAADQTEVMVRSPFVMEDFAKCLGRRKTGVVALPQSRITDEVMLKIGQLKNIAG